MSARKSMIAYAMMQTAADRGGTNPVHAVVPLIERAIPTGRKGQVSLREISKRFEELWGFELPINILRHCLRQHPLRKYISFDPDSKEYIINDFVSRGYEETESIVREKLEFVRSHLRQVAQRETARPESPDQILYSWLDGVAPSFISATTGPTSLSAGEREANRIINLALTTGSDELRAKFRKYITDIALGDLLYKSIVYASEYETLEEVDVSDQRLRMSHVTIFFDTRILFWRLGYYGDEMLHAATELVQMCRSTGAKTAVFSHNRDELYSGLMALAGALGGASHHGWEAVTYALAMGLTRSDAISAAQNIDGKLEALGFEIICPADRIEKYQISEGDLDYELEIGVKQINPDARLRDIRSVAAIFQIREGEPIDFLEKCRAILVTSNSSLAAAVTRYFVNDFRQNDLSPGVQICMTDVVLSTRLWTKLPTSASLAPREQILARSASFLRPNQKLREAFLQKIETLFSAGKISEEEFHISTVTSFADSLLALEHEQRVRTISDEEAIEVARGAVRKLQSIATGKALATIRARTVEEISKIQENTALQLRGSDEEIQRLKENLSSEANENIFLRAELEKYRIQKTNIVNLDFRKAEEIKQNGKNTGILVLLVLLLLLFLFTASQLIHSGNLKFILNLIVGIVVFAAAIAQIYSVFPRLRTKAPKDGGSEGTH